MPHPSRWAQPLKPRHRNFFIVDISDYSVRDDASQTHVRGTMIDMVEQVAAGLGIRWRSELHSDRGDGLLIVAEKRGRIDVLLTDLPRRLNDAVRRHNMTASPDTQIQLRVAVGAGFLHRDEKGYSGDAINRATRLLDAPELKAEMKSQGAGCGVIISGQLYEAIQGFHILDDRKTQKVRVDVKETHTTAWMWIP
ncbi:hypothetical protein ACFOY4_22645 [Actinomadura syzygii]|uniref:Guanylate cyclase domain-containing protein n=1 Tax=Actinomadura syzygii TaxID=1427538 RepID=A0A5D0UNX3_9ACTN|nr:hypothetical protein [Actinomadura syzygii]TYC18739.1 hypothetical protein FXF65_03075 [Actinomadura syzygii]